MATVEFGDTELFEQFEDKAPEQLSITDEADEEEGEGSGRLRQLRQTLGECEETIERLNAENEELKRKLNILSRPAGIKIENSKTSAPVCQINYGSNIISKQCRKEIEDFIFSLVQKQLQINDEESPTPHVVPHPSSFVMQESYKVKTSSDSKQIKNAFSIIGSVLYFTDFCVDKLGQPLLNENPQLTEGWEVPKYQQVFGQIIALEGQDVQIKEKRPKPCCFNCCSEDHHLRDCPEPKDMARINEKRKEFSQNNQGNQRYHAEEVEERFAKYKPGILSQELLDALGITTNTLPPFIYRMRELGYPPGWLKEAELENSGLMLYDGSNDGDENNHSQKVSYDVSQLVDFPGFNVNTPSNIRDDYRSFGSIPMQPQHWKQNFAAFLNNTFPTQGTGCSKRHHESDSTLQNTKKRRSGSDQALHASDMEIESDHDAAQMRPDGFQFHPPFPPGSSSLGTPPPLPLGTPPSTPPIPKGTPPATPPTNQSPSTQVRGVTEGEESEDGLSLEELEEQQRLIWAALEKADTTTNSDSEAGASASETPVPSSPSVVTSLKFDTEEDGEKMEDSSHMFEIKSTPSSPAEPVANAREDKTTSDEQEEHPSKEIDLQAEMSDIIVLDEVYEENGNRDEINGASVINPQESQESSAGVVDDIEEPVINKVTFVPHRSRFAAGIIPFEDTPEFTEVAEATGVYLKIRDLLKGSPRNQAKNKK